MKSFKKYFYYLLVALPLVALCACGDDDENTSDNNSTDSYYVKYEVSNGKQVRYASKTERTIVCKDTNREVTIKVTDKAWEGTYGPFKRGDKVYMRVSSYEGRNSTNGRLSVSKNNEAFAIKSQFNDSRDGGSVSYVINY